MRSTLFAIGVKLRFYEVRATSTIPHDTNWAKRVECGWGEAFLECGMHEKFWKQTGAQHAEGEKQEPTPLGVASQKRIKVNPY